MVQAPPFQNAFQRLRQRLVAVLLARDAGAGNHAVTVADRNAQPAGLVQSLGILPRKRRQFPDGGILLEYDLALAVCIDFQGVAATDNIDTKNLISLIFC